MLLDRAPAVHPPMPSLFERGGDLISFAGGLPDPAVLPAAEIAPSLEKLVRLGGRTTLQYSTPHVPKNLVPAISDLLARTGSRVRAEDLVPTAGSQTGLLVAAMALGAPGAAALCQTPSYPGATAAFRAAHLDVVPVTGDDQGMHPEVLAEALRRTADRPVAFVYLNPTFANPTGATAGTARREELLAVCRRHGVLVLEDDPYALLGADGSTLPALSALDPGNVVALGTFSKTFAPGLRCGWISAPAELVPALRATSEVVSLSPNPLSQAVIAAYHRTRGFDDLLTAYQVAYTRRRRAMLAALDTGLTGSGWTWNVPAGGFYLWLRGPGPDTTGLLAAAADHAVSFVPGVHFGDPTGLRLSYSFTDPARTGEGIARLARVLGVAG